MSLALYLSRVRSSEVFGGDTLEVYVLEPVRGQKSQSHADQRARKIANGRCLGARSN